MLQKWTFFLKTFLKFWDIDSIKWKQKLFKEAHWFFRRLRNECKFCHNDVICSAKHLFSGSIWNPNSSVTSSWLMKKETSIYFCHFKQKHEIFIPSVQIDWYKYIIFIKINALFIPPGSMLDKYLREKNTK